MMNHKDVARKALTGCSHSQPLFVPRKDCTERNLQVWELDIRHNEKQSLRNEWLQIEKERDLAVSELKSVGVVCEKLKAAVKALEAANQTLRDSLKAAKATIADQRTQLHAEQAWRNTPRIPMAHE